MLQIAASVPHCYPSSGFSVGVFGYLSPCTVVKAVSSGTTGAKGGVPGAKSPGRCASVSFGSLQFCTWTC